MMQGALSPREGSRIVRVKSLADSTERVVKVRPPDKEIALLSTGTHDLATSATSPDFVEPRDLRKVEVIQPVPINWRRVTIDTDIPELEEQIDSDTGKKMKFENDIGGWVTVLPGTSMMVITRKEDTGRVTNEEAARRAAKLQRYIQRLSGTAKSRGHQIEVTIE